MRTAIFVLAVLSFTTVAHADTKVFFLAIGNNAPPATDVATLDSDLTPLRYADDDAAAMSEWLQTLGAHGQLLGAFDADTEERYPALAHQTLPATAAQLHTSVAELSAQLARVAAPDDAVAYVFFSGHGSVTPDGEPFLALADGALTQRQLYDDVIAPLAASARFVHLIVDACHAEAIVRPRDLEAQAAHLAPDDAQRLAEQSTLSRFANVGAIVATTVEQRTHEWDAYEHGVFTYEILSGLRGAADVNRDGRVEYSELNAFIGSANRDVSDARARLNIVTHAPAADPKVALVDLRRATTTAWLVGAPSDKSRHFRVEDDRGVRIAELNTEPDYNAALAVPADRTLTVRIIGGEATLRLRPGERANFASLRFKHPALVSRGTISAALTRGLFMHAYGHQYYDGFTDSAGGAPVTFDAAPFEPGLHENVPAPRVRYRPIVAIVLGGATVAAAGIAVGFGVAAGFDAKAYNATTLQKPAAVDKQRYRRDSNVAIGFGAAAVALAVTGAVLFPWHDANALRFSVDVGTRGAGMAIMGTF